MASTNHSTCNRTSSSIGLKTGFCSETGIYHSLRPQVPLPSLTLPTSVTDFAFSLLHSSTIPPPSTAAVLDATTHQSISFPELIFRTKTLSFSLIHHLGLKKGDTAFVLSPNSLQIPILYFSLFSIGVVVSPSNPLSKSFEISHQLQVSKPVIAFVTSDNAHKITSLKTIIIDSMEFESLMTTQRSHPRIDEREVKVYPSDPAAILYSSGTTGMVKGVLLTHQNFISSIVSAHAPMVARNTPVVSLCTVPYFHVYGFLYLVRSVSIGVTVVTMKRFELRTMLRAIEELRVTHVAVAPPLVVAMIKDGVVGERYDLSSLEVISCGGAPLRKSVITQFKKQFPKVQLAQAYGLTESTARVFSSLGPQESQVMGAIGKLAANCEAKIVDPDTGSSLSPGSPGELWLRGASIMKGYVGDEEATAAVLDSEGWLKTGDLCYIDNEGFLFFVDRIKELIKYKAYQVAPAELENLLLSHPDIVEAAIIPYPDEEAGEVPMAFVVRQSGRFIEESHVMDFVSKQVASYKRIRRVCFIDSLPKNAQGKVLRKELIKLAVSSAISKL
ncbi:hypothetical protein K2173_005904 [Erythroxylum novogranatense]|uniref:4-coumarate--CoA ligase n=1 Tax=Erythroxylum novogranatense TaxID=1862640 RepID=A0AAV8U727_9ROSI|nr:hypothetical protein K2173_005904 [Erythroxylum novogranatense]